LAAGPATLVATNNHQPCDTTVTHYTVVVDTIGADARTSQ